MIKLSLFAFLAQIVILQTFFWYILNTDKILSYWSYLEYIYNSLGLNNKCKYIGLLNIENLSEKYFSNPFFHYYFWSELMTSKYHTLSWKKNRNFPDANINFTYQYDVIEIQYKFLRKNYGLKSVVFSHFRAENA